MTADKTIYSEEFTIRGSETDRTGKLSLQALTNLLQEAAGNHAKELGFSVEELQVNGISWLLNRMQLQVQSWPRYSDQIRIETWPSGIEGIYAFREFQVFINETRIASASTAWLVFNLSRRRLIKIPPEFTRKIPTSLEGPLIELKRKFSEVTSESQTIKVKVGWPHLDLNNHTNNVHYYSWMMMATPEAFHDTKDLFFMDAIFKNETSLNDEILIEYKYVKEKVIYKLSSTKTGKEVMTSETQWR